LLSWTFFAGTCAGAEGAKQADTEDNKTAMVWVKVPGFIRKQRLRQLA
jgi:hypothetical protein